MPDEYTNNLRDHLANCYQAGGLTPAGAEQVANHQQPSNPTDQAMLGAYTGMSGSNTNGAGQPTLNQTGGTSQDQPAYPTPDPNHGYDSAADKGLSEFDQQTGNAGQGIAAAAGQAPNSGQGINAAAGQAPKSGQGIYAAGQGQKT